MTNPTGKVFILESDFDGAFQAARQGNDLLLTTAAGENIVIQGFFLASGDARNELVIKDDNGVLWLGQQESLSAEFSFAEINLTEPAAAMAAEGVSWWWILAGVGGVGLAAAAISGGGGSDSDSDSDSDSNSGSDFEPSPAVTFDPVEVQSSSPQLTGQVNDPQASVTVMVDDNEYPATNNGDGTWTLDEGTLPALPNGETEITVTVTQPDGESNTVTGTIMVDMPAPQVIMPDDLNDDGWLNADEMAANVNGAIDVTVMLPEEAVAGDIVQLDDGTISQEITLTADDIANGSITVLYPLPVEGETLELMAVLIDSDGNMSASHSGSLTVDTTLDSDGDGVMVSFDAISDDSDTADDFVTSDNTLLFTGTVDSADGNQLSVTVGETTYQQGSSPELSIDQNGNWTLDLSANALDDGTYPVVATVSDAAGNSFSTDAQNVMIDTDVNADEGSFMVSIDGISDDTGTADDFITSDNTIVITGTLDLDDDTTLSVTFNGVTYTENDPELVIDALPDADGSVVWALDVSAITLADGTYPVSATVTNSQGNQIHAEQEIMIDTLSGANGSAPLVSINADLNDDGWLNSAEMEANGSFSLQVDVTLPVGAVSGDSIRLTDGNDTQLITLTEQDIVNGSITADYLVPIQGETLEISAELVDQVGNVSATGTDSVTVDSLIDGDVDGHTVTFDSISNDTGMDGDFITNDNTLVFNGTLDTDDSTTLSVTVNETTYVQGADPELSVDDSGNWSLDLSNTPLEDGTYNLVATVTDQAGNTISTQGSQVVIDTTVDTNSDGNTVSFDAISEDTGVDGDFITSDNTLQLRGTLDSTDGNTLSVTVGDTTYVQGDDAELEVDEDGNWRLDLSASPLDDGNYSVVATVTDAAGNTASAPAQTVLIDTVIDNNSDGNTVTFDAISQDTGTSGDFITSDNTLVLSGRVDLDDDNTLSVNVGEVTYQFGRDPELSIDANGSWSLDLSATPLDDGQHDVIATVTDVAGNTASSAIQTVIVYTGVDGDEDGFTVSINGVSEDTGAVGDFITSDNTLVISGTVDVDDNNALSVTFNGVTYTEADTQLVLAPVPDANGVVGWSLDVSDTSLADGTYSITATVTSSAGNQIHAYQDVIIDSVAGTDGSAPQVILDADVNDDGWINADEQAALNDIGVTVTINIPDGAVAGDTIELTDGTNTSTVSLTEQDITSGSISASYPLPEEGGSLTVTAVLIDQAGNTSAPGSDSVTLDTLADGDGDGQTVTFDSISADTGTTGDFITSDNRLVFNGSIDPEDGTTLSVRVGDTTYTHGASPELSVDDSGNWSLDLSSTALNDGNYTVVATVADAAGNTSETLAQQVVVDTQIDTNANGSMVTFEAISEDSGVTGDFITNDNTLLLTGTVDLEDGNRLSVSVGERTYIYGDDLELVVDSDGQWVLDLSEVPLSDGDYRVVASVTDMAGNSFSTSSQTVTIDTAIDGDGDGTTVTFDRISEDSGIEGDFITNDVELQLHGAVDTDDDNTLSVIVGDNTYVQGVDSELTTDSNGNWTLDLSALALDDGTYSVTALVTDDAGNIARTISQPLVIDTTIDGNGDGQTVTFDAISDDTGLPGNFITSDNTLILQGTVDVNDDNVLSVNVDGTDYVHGVDPELSIDASGNWTLDLTSSALADGTYTVVATVTDEAGNSFSTNPQSVVIDTVIDADGDGNTVTFDAISIDSGVVGDFITDDNTLLLTGTVDLDDGNLLSVSVGDTIYVQDVDPELSIDAAGNWILDLTATPLDDGSYTVVATVSDEAGNSASSVSQDVVINTGVDSDQDGFTVAITAISDDSGTVGDFVTNDTNLQISGTVDLDDGNDLSITFNGTTYTENDSELVLGSAPDANGLVSWTLDVSGTTLTDGTYPLTATVTSSAGNESSVHQDVVVDTMAGDDGSAPVVILSDDLNDDGWLNAEEMAANEDGNLQVSITLPDGAIAGDTIRVSDGNTTNDFILTNEDIVAGNISTVYPLPDEGSSLTVRAVLIDQTGNTSAQGSDSLSVDTLLDTDFDGATVTFDSISNDSGITDELVTNDNTLLLHGSVDLDDGNTLSVAVGDTTYVNEVDPELTVDDSGNWILDLTSNEMNDGTYGVVATVTDAAGNTISTSPRDVVIDTLIDSNGNGTTVTFDSITEDSGIAGDFITNDNTPVLSGVLDVEDGNTLSVTVGSDSYVLGTDPELSVDDSGRWYLDLAATPLSDGTYSVVTTVTDAAGNTASTESQDLVIDTVVDNDGDGDTVTLDSISEDTGTEGDFITSDNTLRFIGRVDLDDSNILSVAVGDTTYIRGVDPELSVDSSGNWTLDLTSTPLDDGTYTVVATVVDIAGNTDNINQDVIINTGVDTDDDGYSVTIDSMTDDSGTDGDFVTSDTTLQISGSVDLDDNNTLTVDFNGTIYSEADPELTLDSTPDASGVVNWTLDVSGINLADGTYPVTATVTSNAGNHISAQQDIVVDTVAGDLGTAPQVTISDDLNNDAWLNNDELAALTDGNLEVVITLPEGSSVGDIIQVSDGTNSSDLVLSETDISNGSITTEFPAPAEGEGVTITAVLIDVAGNQSATGSDHLTVDTQADANDNGNTVSFDAISDDTGSDSSDFITNDNRLLLTGTVDPDDNTTLSVSVDGTTYVHGIAPELSIDGDGLWTLDLTVNPLEDGTYSVMATVTDEAGNTVSTSSQNVVIDTVVDGNGNGTTVSFDSISDDSGIAGDFMTNDSGLILSGTIDLDDDTTLSVTVGGATYIEGSDTQISIDDSGNWILDLSATPLVDGTYVVVATATDLAGNAVSTSSQNVVIDTVAGNDGSAPQVTITDDSNDDGWLNGEESAANADGDLEVSIDLPAGAAAGDTLQVTDGTTSTDIVLSAADISSGSVSAGFAVPAEGSSVTVSAVLIDQAGNTSATGSDTLTVDTVTGNDGSAPQVTITDDSNDDGWLNGEESAANADGDLDVTVSIPAGAAAGDTLQVTDGTTSTDIVLSAADISSGSVSAGFAVPADGSGVTVSAVLIDQAGNTSAAGSDSVTVDTVTGNDGSAPQVTITDDSNDDGWLNGEESAVNADGDLEVSIDLPAGAAAGDTLQVTDGTTSTDIVLSAADISSGSVSAGFAVPAEGSSVTVSAVLIDQAGNNR
ncbi:Ig-like domain repeat protein [Vibrio ostreae]|uniref:Ig-like domain repeat protein n=2 Tax=Vibrio ostreae TaxID=2841925 RepID=A0A975YMA2_9VIBR|nr:Ig-like domain-containing protein [Vibrio ostreae]QXO16444.1 Ig-like domain repeat protein [Vibrio ostreae]